MKKIISKIFSVILITFIVLFAGISIIGRINAKNNYGVPTVFGYQNMVVVTPSMEPTLKAGKTGIIVKKVNVNSLKKGDIITYYATWSDYNPITHRIMEIENVDNELRFYTMGDKKYNEISANREVSKSDYDQGYTTDKYILGKVIIISSFLGGFYNFTSSPLGFLILILIPCVLLFLCNLKDLIKKYKEESKNEKE